MVSGTDLGRVERDIYRVAWFTGWYRPRSGLLEPLGLRRPAGSIQSIVQEARDTTGCLLYRAMLALPAGKMTGNQPITGYTETGNLE